MIYTVTRTKQELALEEEVSSSCERVGKGRGETMKDDGNEGRDKERMTTKKGIDPFIFIASSRLINNAELHYILTSVFNIFLVERSLRLVTHFHPQNPLPVIVTFLYGQTQLHRPPVLFYNLCRTVFPLHVFDLHSFC